MFRSGVRVGDKCEKLFRERGTESGRNTSFKQLLWNTKYNIISTKFFFKLFFKFKIILKNIHWVAKSFRPWISCKIFE